jgi:predicted O-methyltransferase YrrM
MKGSTIRKIGRLAWHLGTQPAYFPRYVRHNIISNKSALELEVPWFSYAAIDFLDSFLRSTMKVCEYGSGGSTLFFARRASRVLSIEDNPQWGEAVSKKLVEKGIRNVELKLCPFDFGDPTGFLCSDYLHAIPDEHFDIIVIDGTEEWIQVRPIHFQFAEKRMKPGGAIVVDDSWRYENIRKGHHAKHYQTFKSVGPNRPGVTSTDIYFY